MAKSTTIGKVTELTMINPVKAGRGPALRQVLAHVNPENVRKMTTIHFARWVLIDDDTRLLFTSNFDHSLEAYLRDFVQVMPDGMDKIWENCEGYPADGCRNFPEFLAFVQKFQVATTLFYAAYPTATVKDVIKALDVKAKADQFERELALTPAANLDLKAQVDQFQREVAKPPATNVGQV